MSENYQEKFHDFALQKVVEKFGDDYPSYQLKISKPVLSAKNKKMPVWDFDMRGSKWSNGKSIKSFGAAINTDGWYLLIGLIKEDPNKVFFIPAKDVKVSHVRIPVSGDSKYYKYVI